MEGTHVGSVLLSEIAVVVAVHRVNKYILHSHTYNTSAKHVSINTHINSFRYFAAFALTALKRNTCINTKALIYNKTATTQFGVRQYLLNIDFYNQLKLPNRNIYY